MQNVTAKIVFTLEDENGVQMHKSELEYNGLDEQRVLFIEKHMLTALDKMNGEAGEVLKAKGQNK